MQMPEKLGAVTIEPAEARDVAELQALLATVEAPTDIAEHVPDFLVARRGGELVGCIGMEVRGTDALFRSLVVRPGARHAGLGTMLYLALSERARERGVEQAYLLTRTIESLAGSWGFRRIAREAAPAAIRSASQFHGDHCTSAAFMHNDLRAAEPRSDARGAGGA